jgi:hypothetical protein
MSKLRQLIAVVVGCVVVIGGLVALRPDPSKPPARVVVLESTLGFPGALDWQQVACSDVAADDLCQSQWMHREGQVARVLLLPVPDPSKLATLSERLSAQARAAGGIAEVVDGAQRAIRLLQPMRDASHDDALVVSLTYVLTAPEGRALHLLTSTVPISSQEPGDQRLRDLLAFGAWLASDAP